MKQIAAFLSVFVFSGCAVELPIGIWLDSGWDNEEERVILRGLKAWEDATELDVFTYMGRYKDSTFTKNDFYDNRHVIYKAMSSNSSIEKIEKGILEEYGVDSPIAFARHNCDVVILWYGFDIDYSNLLPEEIEIVRSFYFFRLEELIMHEFGHLLGLEHSDVPEAIMYLGGSQWPDGPDFSEDDINQFCGIYDCP